MKLNFSIIDQICQKQLSKKNYNFDVGDLISVEIKLIDNQKKEETKTKKFEGIVAAKKGKSIDSSFTIYMINKKPNHLSDDEIIEISFPLHSPLIKDIKVIKKLKQKRRAKLYYLKKLKGKKIKIREKK